MTLCKLYATVGVCVRLTTRVSQIKTLNIFICYHGRYDVLIHDSHPDVRLFHSLLRGDFPSRLLQLLQWSLVSLLGVSVEVEESMLQNYCRS